MRRTIPPAAAVLAIVAMAWLTRESPLAQTPLPPADLVLINGQVLTVDARDSVAQAVAISGGRIVAVGTTAQIQPRLGANTEVIDLHGRTVTPGLIDSHVHFSEAEALFNVDLGDEKVKTMADVLDRIAAKAATLKPGEWLQGRGWDEGKLAERRYITAADLDKVSPNNPVWLMHTTGHYGVANSYALKMAEVRKDTKDPPVGTIDRDAQGHPSGVMKESAMDLVSRLVPPLTREQQKQGLIKIIEDFNREGMTGAKDPGIGQAKWELYEELLREGKLSVRVFALWSGARRLEDRAAVLARVQAHPRLPASLGEGLLTSGGVKMFMDGSGGARTAWMHEAWNKNLTETDTGNTGYPAMPPEVYRQIVTELHNAGVHVSTHAIGDRAIDWVVDTYDQALAARPTRGLRHGIIHANTPTDHAIDVMARLQRDSDAGYPESQATFLWWIGDNYAANLGRARAPRLKPFQTFVKAGITWGGGSDYPVTPFPARYGLWASVARQALNGSFGATPFGMSESVSIQTALRSYTIWAAHAMFLDDRIGSIEVGKDADLAVWDRNMYTMPTDAIKDLTCELTLLKGRVVYRSSSNAQAGAVPASPVDLVLINGRVLTVDAQNTVGQAIAIGGGRVVAAGTTEAMRSRAGTRARVIDLEGRTVMPAIISTHGHPGFQRGLSYAANNYTRDTVINDLHRALYFGVSVVQSQGIEPGDVLYQIRADQHAGTLGGAALLVAGRGIGAPNAGPGGAIYAGIAYDITTEIQARRAVEALAARHVDIVKIWVDDRNGRAPRLSPALYRAVIDEAHARGLRVNAHVFYHADAVDLVDAGIDGLAHLVRDLEMSDALVAAIVRRNVYVMGNLSSPQRATVVGTPPWLTMGDPMLTLLHESVSQDVVARMSEAFGRRDPKAADGARERYGILQRSLAKLNAAGAKLILGPDTGLEDHLFGLAEQLELEAMVEAGMTPAEGLVAATRRAAEYLHLDDRGSLTPGKRADLLVLDANPLESIVNTRRISRMFLSGVEVDRAALRRGITD